MLSEKKERLKSIDYAECVAIFLVCQTHYLLINESAIDNFVGILSNIGVPLFLMANGALLLNKPLRPGKSFYLKTLRIFILSIVWKIITIASMSLIKGISPFASGKQNFINYLIGNNTLDGYEAGHFWYLYALIGIYILFPLIKRCLEAEDGEKIIKIFTCVVLFFTFLLKTIQWALIIIDSYISKTITINVEFLNAYSPLGAYAGCLAWFLVGGLLFRYQEKLRKAAAFPIMIIGLILLFVLNRYQIHAGMDANGIVIDGYYVIPTLLFGGGFFSLLIANEKSLPRIKLVESISKNTWGIYMLHMIVGLPFARYYSEMLPVNNGILLNTVKAFWMLFGSLIITAVLKKVPVLKKLFL